MPAKTPKPTNAAAARSPPTTGDYGANSAYSPETIQAILSIQCPTCNRAPQHGCLTAAGYLTVHMTRLDAGRRAAYKAKQLGA
jgi:hypothetical protein